MKRFGHGLALLVALATASVSRGEARDLRGDAHPFSRLYETQLPAEAIARGPCESVKSRVFVAHAHGSECIAYHVVGSPTARHTVFFLDGDVPPEQARRRKQLDAYLAGAKRFMASRAGTHGVRFVFVGRPGVFGSSGNHAVMKSENEVHTINAAVDAIKLRLGIERISLAGQSGGSMVAAGLLTLGREDVACAVLASGGFDMAGLLDRVIARRGTAEMSDYRERMRRQYYEVIGRSGQVKANVARRLFVVGDRRDTRTPFDLQQRYADAMQAAGHHAVMLEAKARDKEHHGLTAYAIELAARCAKGEGEAMLRRVLVAN